MPGGTTCACGYSAPVAGGTPTVFARDVLSPRPLPGTGDGPFETTVYVAYPAPGYAGARLGTVTASGTPQPVAAFADTSIEQIAATAEGVAELDASPAVVIRYATTAGTSARVIGSLATQPADNIASLGADELAGGTDIVAWSQSNGGFLYDTRTARLFQFTSYDYPIVQVAGNCLMWGNQPAAKGPVDDPDALEYHLLVAESEGT